jgi:CDP-paratose synthetase
MKIFITGATGFIGKHLIFKLLEKSFEVTINIRNNSKNIFGKKVKTYQLGFDIEKDIDFLKMEQFDGVVHLASYFVTSHKPNEIEDLIDSNVKFASYILECASQARIKWFVNTGTFWQHYQNEIFSPVNFYAATKQAFENIAQFYIETNQIHFCTLKLSDTYGPYDTRKKIFNLWKNIAMTGESLDMSPGNQLIDIVYIDDVINAFLLLIDTILDKPNGVVYVLKSERRYTLKELSFIFENCTNQKLNINWGGKSYNDREVMVPWESGELIPGWKQKISIVDGINKIFSK